MAKKRKKQRKSSASHNKPNSNLSLEAQEQRVQTLYHAGKYKEASESCKKLLKQEKRPEWLEMLAAIYQERSKELAAKKMYKEAIMIWRNRAEVCGKPLVNAFYFRTLLDAGMSDQVFALYQYNKDELEQTGILGEVREHLAATSLGRTDEMLKMLPTDDALVKDYPVALAALEAYCAGDDKLLHSKLKEISFRSPFRDLRQILKALSLPQDDSLAAKKLLDRVASDSPFMPLAEAVLLSYETNEQLFANVAKLNRETLRFVFAKRGFDTQFTKLTEEISQIGSSASAKTLLQFVLSHRNTLGVEYARDTAFRLLVHFAGGTANFTKIFGKLSALEKAQIDVWREEKNKASPFEISKGWGIVEFFLTLEHCALPEDYPLSVALISRRVLQRIDDFEPNDTQNALINSLLTRILDNDATDRASYIRLIAIYRQQGSLKDARYWLDRAMENFSDDVPILTEAVETALASKAYKKAAVLAKRILTKDPINKRVRCALIDSHLSHSRKLIGKDKYSLAEKELDIAESWVKSPMDKARVDLVRGIWLLDDKQPTKAATIWTTATNVLGGGLCGHFHLLLELLHNQRSVATVLKTVGIKLSAKTLSKDQTLAFFRLLNGFDKAQQTDDIISAVDLLEPILGRTIKLNYNMPELEKVCDVLDSYHLHDLLLKFSTNARKQWPTELAFIYYKIAARTATEGFLSGDDFTTLDSLTGEAGEALDKKLLHRIISLLNESIMPPNFNDTFDPTATMEQMPDFDDLIEMMVDSVPPGNFKNMKQEMGDESFREFVIDMVTQNIGSEHFDAIDDNFNPFKQSPKKKKKVNKKNESTSKPDQQLELF